MQAAAKIRENKKPENRTVFFHKKLCTGTELKHILMLLN
jgi:hypothetical protein